MALKEILQQWDAAVREYRSGQFAEALRTYSSIDDPSARMYYNMACAHIKLEQHLEAIQCLTSALSKDSQLAIAFFKRGVLHLTVNILSEAKDDLHTTLTLLRGNPVIDYKQLGLLYKLHRSEVLYNVAVTEVKEGDMKSGEDTLYQALYDAQPGHRRYIQDALAKIQTGNTKEIHPVYPSTEHVFMPPKVLTDNLEKRKYIPKARVVSAANISDVDPSFDLEKRIQEIRRFSEISEVNTPPKSPLLALRRVFQKGNKSSTPGMRLNKSTGDLQALPACLDFPPYEQRKKSPSVANVSFTSGSEVKCKRRNVNTNRYRRLSLGSLFGNNLTAVSQALVSSCDVLTAVVTPAIVTTEESTENSDECATVGFSQTGEANTTGKELCDWHAVGTKDRLKGSNEDKDKGFANDASHKPDSYPVVKMTEGNKNDFEKLNVEKSTHKNVDSNGQIDYASKSDDHSNGLLVSDEVNNNDVEKSISESQPVQRRRPPPPSYPPPPLPARVVINL